MFLLSAFRSLDFNTPFIALLLPDSPLTRAIAKKMTQTATILMMVVVVVVIVVVVDVVSLCRDWRFYGVRPLNNILTVEQMCSTPAS